MALRRNDEPDRVPGDVGEFTATLGVCFGAVRDVLGQLGLKLFAGLMELQGQVGLGNGLSRLRVFDHDVDGSALGGPIRRQHSRTKKEKHDGARQSPKNNSSFKSSPHGLACPFQAKSKGFLNFRPPPRPGPWVHDNSKQVRKLTNPLGIAFAPDAGADWLGRKSPIISRPASPAFTGRAPPALTGA